MKKILDYIKKHQKIILTMILLISLNFLMLYDNLQNGRNIIFFSITMLIQIILTICCFKKTKKIENMFLIMAIPIGILFMLILPVGKAPDEALQFLRAYEISEGKLVSDQDEYNNGVGYFTESIYDNIADGDYDYKDTLKDIKKENSPKKRKYIYTTLSLYSFICYIPQAFGIFIAKLFNAPILIQAYSARLFNLMTFIILMYMSIKIIPYKKKSLLFIGTIPLMLQTAGSITADCITIASSILLISYILKISEEKEKLTIINQLIIVLLSLIVSLSKIVYLPICLLALIIPKEKFKSKKQKIIKIALLVFICSIISLIWLSIASKYLVEFQEGVDTARQIKYAITHPISYLMILIRTIKTEFLTYSLNAIGYTLGMLDIILSGVYAIPALIILNLIFLTDKSDKNIKNYKIVIMAGLFILISTLIFSTIYAQWTPYRHSYVNGVQGRYFYPILILIPFMFDKVKIESKIDDSYFYAFFVAFNLYGINSIFQVF